MNNFLTSASVLLLLPFSIATGQVVIEEAFPNLNFTRPVDLQYAPDGSDRLFVIEQEGYIYVFENDPSVTDKALFLDIHDRIVFEGERGLLGLAFHPDYENNGYFFVNYTAPNPLRTVVSRFQVTTDDPDNGDELSESITIEINQPYANHNGGQIVFGPDSYLYIGMGDGGWGGDPYNNAQDLTTLLGAMLRIDVDNVTASLNYGIPEDNPFVADTLPYRDEIYAYGLRNPWRFSFDSSTNSCWIADVGQDHYEEIDILEYGGNYGWNIMEGFNCYNPATGCDTTGLILPVYTYDHSSGESITGGFVYRGALVPDIYGKYIFADFEYGDVWSLEYDGGNLLEVITLGDLGPYSVTSFGIDQQDELYICSFDGKIYKFVQTYSTVDHDDLTLNKFSLYHNYPNPFNPVTWINYNLPLQANVTITVYDMLGGQVRTLIKQTQNVGYKSVMWDATNDAGSVVSAGIYLYMIQAEGFMQSKKMVLLK
jgi:glucose/arabinose dehydrogenase